MRQFLHLLETLVTHLDRIRMDLDADWPEFAEQMKGLAPAFEAAKDETELARAVGDLYMACRTQAPVMAILRQTADTSGVGHDRRLPAGGIDYGDTVLVREIVNRFQSLLASLEGIEQREGDKNQRSASRSQSTAEDAHDR